MFNSGPIKAVALFIVVTATLSAFWIHEHNSDPDSLPTTGIDSASQLEEKTRSIPAEQATRILLSSQPVFSTRESKHDEVERLTKTGKPEDAFKAFKIIHHCQVDKECDDLSPGQLTMAYNLLKQAVEARVPKSIRYVLYTTPDGRPAYEVRDDPAYSEWRAEARKALETAAYAGDRDAMNEMAELSMLEGHPEKALMYWTAYLDGASPQLRQAAKALTERYSNGLTEAQITAAETQGRALGRSEN